ncbi:E3 SUMO-protein ligase KIAA1586-like [Pecten maximus]|uniref:E3 SUMO-protein ligase KIAA1586-like n=1 Tax=Pecten maximus TaxID=6579 RepID=UPI001457F790|nr:E3 SUMO-protein ligase KIAA1586-like [Pecten maximus]
MSHNSKYYVKRLTKKDSKGLTKVSDFKKSSGGDIPNNLSTSESTSNTESTVQTECLPEANVNVHVTSDESPALTLSVKKRSSVDRRKFNAAKYESAFSWLYHSSVTCGYMCKYCELFVFGAHSSCKPFVTKGVKLGTHPSRKLKKHDQSSEHKAAVQHYALSRSNVNVYQQLKAQGEDQIQYNREVVKKIFKCVDFLIRQKWAATENMAKVVKFVAGLGVKDLQQYLIQSSSHSVKYVSSSSVTQMITCISNLLERQILHDIHDKEFSFLADESADLAHRSQLSIMARFAQADQTVKTHFLGFVQLEKGTAEAIMEAIQGFLIAKDIDIANIRFMGFDGCNTMSGIQKDLQRRIRHVSPFAVYINCRNHRLALCLVHLIKQFPLLQDVDSTLLSLWKMFEFSPQKTAVFKHVQAVYGKEPLAITRAATTRWLSHLQASARFVSRYTCILDTLDDIYAQKKEPEVYGIRLAVTDKKVVATILLLCDILKPVNVLSWYLQNENINFTPLPQHVKTTTDQLHALVTLYQSDMAAANLELSETEFSKCHGLFREIDDRTDLRRRMRQDNAAVTPESFLNETGIPLIFNLIQEVEDAFCTGAPVLTAFGFLDPQNLPDTIQELGDYGKTEIERIVDFYGTPKEDTLLGHTVNVPSLMDPVILQTELNSFKIQLFMLRLKLSQFFACS